MLPRRSGVAAYGLSVLLVSCLGHPASGETYDPALFRNLQWRGLEHNIGGRSIAAAGSSTRPNEYYFGATGGGLWKSTDGGVNWQPVTDGQIRSSSVGAVAVAPSDADVVYIGMGEVQLRGNAMQGDGVYKSIDAGETWKHLGLEETQAIGRIRIHPRNPNIVYVAALGHPFGDNEERGIYKTQDGGATWKKVLYRDEKSGAVDLAMDPNEPNTLYAVTWQVYRKPWKLWDGGPGSGLFKSTDGGESWREITRNEGLPEGILGKLAVTVSGADSSRVYANIEAEEGGLYRSDNGGETWQLINRDRKLWQRSFYFMRTVADPKDRDTIYVLNYQLEKSTDGGQTFESISTPHLDHHDLWIDPNDPGRMISANDGGGTVSVNGGESWTQQDFPTAQIYRLEVTRDFPYHACGSQQDNLAFCVSSESPTIREPGIRYHYSIEGGENTYIVSHKDKPHIFYTGRTNTLLRYNRRSNRVQSIHPWPRIVMGEPAEAMPERWSWVYPIAQSPVDADIVYAGSQHVWKTEGEGETWQKISPDLTRALPETLKDSGGEVILDQDGPEIYATIYTIAPSPHAADTVWTGSDDGLVHITRDGGRSWYDVTPADMPVHTRIGLISVSPHAKGTAYVAGRRYEMDDRTPYIWRTRNYGGNWKPIVTGIEAGDFVHVVHADPQRAGLLYAGTEHGVYVSFDDGDIWQSLQQNLPATQVSGIHATSRDLVISTHGRGFFVLDDIAPLRQMKPSLKRFHLFSPTDAVRPVAPAVIDYNLASEALAASLTILDAKGRMLRNYDDIPTKSGAHRISWDLRHEGATVFEGMILEGRHPDIGPMAAPGQYAARLTVDGSSRVVKFSVLKDPRLVGVDNAELAAQTALALDIRDATSAANETVMEIRDIRSQMVDRLEKGANAELQVMADRFLSKIAEIEGSLYQVKNERVLDMIALPIKLNNRLSGLLAAVDQGEGRPTKSHYEVFEELSGQLDQLLARFHQLKSVELERLNHQLERLGLLPIVTG